MLRLIPSSFACLLLLACSPFPSPDDLEAPLCTEEELWNVDSLRIALGSDYLAIVSQYDGLVFESGPRCGSAADTDACEEFGNDPNGLGESGRDPYYPARVWVRTGDHRDHLTLDETIARLAPIDTLDEAFLVAVIGKYRSPRCEVSTTNGGRSIDGEWEIVSMRDIECPRGDDGQRDLFFRHVLRIDGAGNIRRIARDVAVRGPLCDHCACFDRPPSLGDP